MVGEIKVGRLVVPDIVRLGNRVFLRPCYLGDSHKLRNRSHLGFLHPGILGLWYRLILSSYLGDRTF